MSAIASQITGVSIVAFYRLLRRKSRKTEKLRITDLCEGNSSASDEFPAYRGASNAEDVSIWWRHHNNNNAPSLHFVMNGSHPILSTIICAYWSHRMLISKPVKQPCQIWINASHCHLGNYDITTTKLSKTKHTLCSILINCVMTRKPRFDVPSPVTWHEQQAPIREPLWGEFSGDRGIPRIQGQ